MLDRSTLYRNPFVRGIIRRKMHLLAKYIDWTGYTAEDIEQELFLVLLQSLEGYDSQHSSHANVFITTVIERAAAGILRKRNAQKRGDPTASLDQLMAEIGDGEELSVTHPTAVDKRSDFELCEIRHDVAVVLATLPADLRDLADRLQRDTLSQVARELGVPQGTLKRRRDRLRHVFEWAGFGKNL